MDISNFAIGYYVVAEGCEWHGPYTLFEAYSEAGYCADVEHISTKIVHIIETVHAQDIGPCEFNGVTPGIDFPATM